MNGTGKCSGRKEEAVSKCHGHYPIPEDEEGKKRYESALRHVAIAKENGVELAILQPRSPSCGAAEVYDGTFTGRKIPGQGVFAALLRENGIPVRDADTL